MNPQFTNGDDSEPEDLRPHSGCGKWREKFTPEQIIEALKIKHGMVYLAARAVGCDPKTIYNMMRRHPEIKVARDNLRGQMIDVAESALHKLIVEGNVAATIFFLKTQGKKRGYVERVQNQIEVVKPIQIQGITSPLPTKEQLIKNLREHLTKYDAEARRRLSGPSDG